MTGGHLKIVPVVLTTIVSWINFGCWNMRSLVESKGSVATREVVLRLIY